MKWLIALVLLLGSVATNAIDTEPAFEDESLQARYEAIIEEVRCLKCQNQSLKDSPSFLAADLRREIRRMLAAGNTDAEIYDFLVARYGEFALYRPRAEGKTLVLWMAPGLLLLGGLIAIALILRRRAAMSVDDDETADEQFGGTS